MYTYRVLEVTKVLDGDTVDVVIDLGFRMTTLQRLRIKGIDTPEKGDPMWAEAKDATAVWLEERKGRLLVQTWKADSFGRYLGDLYRDDDMTRTLSEHLRRLGHREWKRGA